MNKLKYYERYCLIFNVMNLLTPKIFLYISIASTLFIFIYLGNVIRPLNIYREDPLCHCKLLNKTIDRRYDNEEDFEGFNNESGTEDGRFIVPNYVHFLRFGIKTVSFIDSICILAALKNQKPSKIFIHYDDRPQGKYWDILMKNSRFKEILQLVRTKMPTAIYNKELNPGWVKWHASDVIRIKILMTYGGVFLDNDSYIIRRLDDFRRFEMTLGWMENEGLASQVIIAHKSARFLVKWLKSFKDYNASLWYYNAGIRPTKEILEKSPHLIHREKYLLANHYITQKLYLEMWPEWRSHYAIHLLYNHQYILQKNLTPQATYPVEFNEVNIQNYPVTIREMANDVFPP